jgi:hypothetical protein
MPETQDIAVAFSTAQHVHRRKWNVAKDLKVYLLVGFLAVGRVLVGGS